MLEPVVCPDDGEKPKKSRVKKEDGEKAKKPRTVKPKVQANPHSKSMEDMYRFC